jgi:hypothetical protein
MSKRRRNIVTQQRLLEKRWKKELRRRQVRARRNRQKSEHYGQIVIRQPAQEHKTEPKKPVEQPKAKRGLVSMIQRFYKPKV